MFLSALEGNDIVTDILQFDEDDNTLAALTSNVNKKVYRVQQRGKKQQRTLTHVEEGN
jgi:hypothetical protein